MQKTSITTRQFRNLVIINTIGSAILLKPGSMATLGKQDGWLITLFGIFITLLFLWFFIIVGKINPEKNIIELMEEILGKWLGKAVAFVFICFQMENAASLAWVAGNFITTQIMPETPKQVNVLLFMIVIVFAVRLGIETIAISSDIACPLVIGLSVIFFLLLLPKIKPENLQPVLENGIRPLLTGSLSYIVNTAWPFIYFLMIFPAHVSDRKAAQKALIMGSMEGGFILFITTLFAILVLGWTQTSLSQYPTYALATKINIGTFLTRIEAIIAILWLTTLSYRTMLYFYTAVAGLAQILNLKNYRFISLPMGMIVFSLSIILYPSTMDLNKWDSTALIPFTFTFCVLLPLTLLIVAKLRRYKSPNNPASTTDCNYKQN